MKIFLNLVVATLKDMVRDKMTIFWSFSFRFCLCFFLG